MTDIMLEKINESFVKVHCEKSTAMELRDFFTFRAKNYKFHPMYKSRVWDGNIRLYNINTSLIPTGLASKIIGWAKDNDYSLDVQNPLQYIEKFDDAEEFIQNLNLPEKITRRDYQDEAFVDSIQKKRSVVVCPTASGKSLIIYMAIRKLVDMLPGEKGLLVVPTTSLVEQMYSDFAEYGYDVETHCHRVHGQVKKGARVPSLVGKTPHISDRRDTDKPITITTWQSIQKQPKEWFHQFSWIVGDEAHHFQAKALTYIMENLVNAEFRIGTTGTIEDGKIHALTLQGHFGSVKEYITTSDLMDRGLVSNLEIKGLVLKHDKDVCDFRSKENWNYQKEIEYLIGNEKRNKFIVKLALKQKGNCLVLFNHVEKHGHVLEKMFGDTIHTKKVFYIHGGIKTSERETIREYANTHDDCVILASYGTYSTGVNLPNLQSAIFAIGFKSKIRVLQSIGRTLRLDGGDNHAVLFDICDDMSKGKNQNFALAHFLERMELYFKQRFNVKMVSIDI